MLEIGFGCGHHVQGRSAIAWNKFFENDLQYYAIDYIAPENFVNYKGPTCLSSFNEKYPGYLKKIFWGSQANTTLLNEIVKEMPKKWDIIVDDGSHDYSHIITSFEYLWPHVVDGGLYVIEDLQNNDRKFHNCECYINILKLNKIKNNFMLLVTLYLKDLQR